MMSGILKRRISAVVSTGAFGVGLVLLACSSSDGNGSDGNGSTTNGATTGGNATLTSTSAGGATASSVFVGGATSTQAFGGNATTSTSISSDTSLATAACVDYVKAQCQRRSNCLSSSTSSVYYDSCVANARHCPALFFSPGANNSVESLRACMPSWDTFSCEELNAGKYPSCVVYGTRSEGQPCRFSSQCSTGLCSAQDPAGCGQCVTKVQSGANCIMTPQCPDGHSCSFGRCLQIQTVETANAKPNGTACNYDGSCLGACAPSAQGDQCITVPKVGEKCLVDLPAKGARACQWQSYCDSSGVCRWPGGVGSACLDAVVPCDASYCDSVTGFAPGTCKDWLSTGAVCNPVVPNICGENDRCICDDATCKVAHCVRYTTSSSVACDSYTRCGAGYKCVNGTCTAEVGPYLPPDCTVAD